MTLPTAIALVGAAGRMGLEITRATLDREDVRITAALEREGAQAVGKDLGRLAGADPIGVAVGTRYEEAFARADAIIDLSLPQATPNVVRAARKTQTPLVCGTTGLGRDADRLFDEAAGDIPVLYATNLSVGVAVLAELVEQAARALGPGYDIEIVETHHNNKVDAPSGTALTIAKAAARARALDADAAFRFGREGHTGKRSESEIGIHAVRGGGVFGDHTVLFAGRDERLELTHRAASRALFARGALEAARFLADRPKGRYTMADLLGLGRN